MLLGELVPPDIAVSPEAAAIEIAGLSADSRAVSAGFLFAALPGTAADGGRFAGQAVASGAVAVLAGNETRLSVPAGVPVIRVADPRHVLALSAARFYPEQPAKLVAVTGTSGKTSVVTFAREIFEAAGHPSASIGTVGIDSAQWSTYGRLTTMDPVALHQALDRLAREGVTHAALEASSHGLDQHRLDGVRLTAAAFTNLGRDHMDYHPTVAAYLAAKLRLFEDLLPPAGTAVVDMDGAHSDDALKAASARGARLIRTGQRGVELRLLSVEAEDFRQHISVEAMGSRYDVVLPLAGAFQVSNALVAAGLAIGAGVEAGVAIGSLERLAGAPGRLELVGRKENGALVFVDYAHKPEALATVLKTLRPLTRGRLVVVFGAGGDRDAGKRPLMGAAAAAHADRVIVTDDNPRSEDPARIRSEILGAAPGAVEIGDRAAAIHDAIAGLGAGDVLCIAGKGHETGQIVGTQEMHFSDHEVARSALAGEAAA